MMQNEKHQNMPTLSTIIAGHEIDAAEQVITGKRTPYHQSHFDSIGITAVWEKYDGILTWGEGQSLAIVDDGCDLSVPEWQDGKVRAAWNAFEQNDDPTPVPPGYHGTSVGYPSSLRYNGLCGVAYNNQTVQIRSCTIVHLPQIEGEDITLARALNWIADHAEQYNITAVNLSALDDKPHTEPVPTVVDEPLRRLREMNIWVSAPCGNNQHTTGISWPACQPYCYGIGSVEQEAVYNDRYANTDLLVHAGFTSSSNAYVAGSYQIWREAVMKTGFPWQDFGKTLPEAAMAIFHKTGRTYFDEATNRSYPSLNLLAAIDFVMNYSSQSK